MKSKDKLAWIYLALGCVFASWSYSNWQIAARSQLTTAKVLQSALLVDEDGGYPWFQIRADLAPTGGGDPFRWQGTIDVAFMEEALNELQRWAPGALRQVELNRGGPRRARATDLNQNPRFNLAVLLALCSLVFLLPALSRLFLPPNRHIGVVFSGIFVFFGFFPIAIIPSLAIKAYDRNNHWQQVVLRDEGMTPDWSRTEFPANIEFTPAGRKAIEGSSHRHFSYEWQGQKFILGDGPGYSRLLNLREENKNFRPPQAIWVNPAFPDRITSRVGWGRDFLFPVGILLFFGLIVSGLFFILIPSRGKPFRR